MLHPASEAAEDTNIVAAAQSDEDASWESVFIAENQIPFHINFYKKGGLFYELMETSEYKGAFYTSVFSEKRRITGRLGMKLHVDAGTFYDEGDLQEVEDYAIDVRRLRLNSFGRGYLFTPFTYGFEFGLSASDFYFTDGYIWFHDVPYVASVKFGIFTPPMSMEVLQSASFTPMMEDAAPVNIFTPGDLLGLQFGGATLRDRVTLYTGWFSDVGSSENQESSESYSRLMARATWLPLDGARDGATGHLVHLGLNGSHMFVAGDGIQYRGRPESFLAPFVVDTGVLAGDRAFSYGIEGAWQNGPLLIQSEFMQSYADDELNEMHRFEGVYLLANFALTGEQRRYNRDSGIFSRLRPRSKFSFKEKTWGAYEWSSRISYTSLSDDTVKGGDMMILSSGLNIYLNERNRLMIMAGVADVKDTTFTGELYYIQSRLQIDL